MNTSQRMDSAIAERNLLNHPFYQAWNAGTLPVADLQLYAREYGNYIATVSEGWRALGLEDYAKEEEEHTELWRDFAAGIDTDIDTAQTPEVQELLAVVGRCYQDPASAVGGLYAFEAQQPHTSASKLKGLKDHYAVGTKAEVYFEIHAVDFDEPALLAKMANELSPEDAEKAVAACEEVSVALWNALSGVHSGTC